MNKIPKKDTPFTFVINGVQGYTMDYTALVLGISYKTLEYRFRRDGMDLKETNNGVTVTAKLLPLISSEKQKQK